MVFFKKHAVLFAGALAGILNGLFGTGGGMILIPMLQLSDSLDERQLFPASVSIILPITLVTLTVTQFGNPLPFQEALPYLLGGCFGGLLSGLLESKVPACLLHRIFGGMVLWGGIRYLC